MRLDRGGTDARARHRRPAGPVLHENGQALADQQERRRPGAAGVAERVLAVVAAGPSLFDGPSGPMTAARFRDLAWRLEWDVLVWKEGVARGNTFASFGDVFGIPQADVQAMARGEKPVSLALGNALESITDGVRGHKGRSEEDGDGRNGADQRTEG